MTGVVMLLGVVVGYLLVQQGFNFQPRAQTYGRGLATYGWNGVCFSNLTGIKYGALYQCAGKITNYPQGCQGSVSKRLYAWSYKSTTFPLISNGKSNVCIVVGGASAPKDANGCYTQQLDVDNGSAGSPEGFYSYDSCSSSKPTPTNPKPTNTPTPTPVQATPTPTPTAAPTPTGEPTPTPTTPICQKPPQPVNVSVSCGTCR